MSANRQLLYSALRNLVDNAVQYGAVGGHVWINAHLNGACVVVRVCDDGPGVSVDDRDRLTQRFFRVLGSSTSGSGLGLSIVAHIVGLHNGELRFKHRFTDGQETHGLCVHIYLPQVVA